MSAHDPHPHHPGVPEPHPHGPLLRVVRGDPTAEEVAALVAVLVAASGGGGWEEELTATSQWAPPERLMRAPVFPTGWWASALPR